MPTCAFVSFRLGMTDGVSVVAETWMAIFRDLGFDVTTVAGDGPVDHRIDGLAMDAVGVDDGALGAEVAAALSDADLVVVENLATLPLNLPAARAVGRVLVGRPAILHHHDPPWQRDAYRAVTELPLRDAAWRHVAINDHTAAEMRARGFEATTIYNGFAEEPPGDRAGTRTRLGIADAERVLVHPVRAIARKDVPAAIRLAEVVGATYWLTGPAEEGYGPTLDALIASASCRIVHEPADRRADLYAACDAVLFPSITEGFGNPPVEAALAGRHCVVGTYPMADELRDLGFAFVAPDDVEGLAARLVGPMPRELDRNAELAREHFSLERVARELAGLLARAGWS